jgi:hypothetical protein
MKRKPIYFYIYLIFLLQNTVYQVVAQDRKNHEKGTYVDSTQRYYQQASLPAYISIGTSPEGKSTTLNPAKSQSPKPMYLDGHGTHYIRHRNPSLPNGELSFEINADGRAPLSTLRFFDAPTFQKNGKLFFGQNLKMSVVSKDEMSGLQKIYQSIDRTEYSEDVTKIALDREKEYFVQYYAVDNVGNEEKTQQKTFTVDLTAPQTNYTVKGDQIDNVISPRTMVSLTANDELSGVNKIVYRVGEEGATKNYATALNFANLGDGEHSIYFRATDNVKNEEEENTFAFYLDKMPPIITAEILGDRYVIQGKTFFSGRTKLQLEAIDNKAGVKDIYYAIDGITYQKYEKPFYIPNRPGHHIVNYYATDLVNNKGSGKYERTVTSMFMDLSGPRLSFNYIGEKFDMNNNIYISPRTKINLLAQDPESGVQNIEYQVDGATTDNFKNAFQIENEGTHQVDFTGFDNVNNSNNKSFEFIVDATAPEIFAHFSLQAIAEESKFLATAPKNGGNTANTTEPTPTNIAIYPKHLTIFLGATDNMVGTDRIYYSINGGAEQLYQNPLTNFPIGKITKLKIRAIDKLGNQDTEEQEFMVVK